MEVDTDLHVVFVDLPGEIIKQLIIAVEAVPRDAAGCTELRHSMHEDNRESVIGQGSRTTWRGDAGCTKSNGTRMEILIRREKSFRKAVPPIAQLVYLICSDRMCVGDRDQLDAGRSVGIEAGELPTAGSKGQGERLHTITKKIAASEDVAGIEVLVDFCDQTGEPIKRGGNNRGKTIGGNDSRVRIRKVGSRPGMPAQKALNDWIRGIAGLERSIRRRTRRNRSHGYHAHRFLLSFIIQVKESFVFDDGPTD